MHLYRNIRTYILEFIRVITQFLFKSNTFFFSVLFNFLTIINNLKCQFLIQMRRPLPWYPKFGTWTWIFSYCLVSRALATARRHVIRPAHLRNILERSYFIFYRDLARVHFAIHMLLVNFNKCRMTALWLNIFTRITENNFEFVQLVR